MARVQRRRLEDDYKKMDDRESGNRLEVSLLSSNFTRGEGASQVDQKGGRINMLTDEILVLILSKLSLKEAMATSILSSRWKNLWMFTSKLDLHIDFLETSNMMRNIERRNLQSMFVKWFDRLYTRLQLVKPSTNLVEFRLSFHLSSSFATWIDDWLSYAVSRKAERLDLIFVAYQDEKRYSFPYNEGNFPANLKLLKKLSLHYVDVSGEAVTFILGNCRLLEQLSLHQTGTLSSLEVVGTSLVFKCLEISECTSLKSVVVHGSELVCIKYNGVGNRRRCRFVLINVPMLTQLWIQAEPHLLDLIAMLDMFDSVLPQLHTLKIYSTFIISYGVHFVEKMMPSLEQFVVVLLGSDYCDKCSLMPWFGVVSSPCLQRFVVEASHYEMSKKCFKCSTFNHNFGDGDHADRKRIFSKWCRYQIPSSYSHIKEVEFVGYRGMSNQFQMIKQFIQYSTALDKIIVDPRSFEQRRHMLSDRIYRNHMEDEIFARNRARDQFKDSRINVTIL